MNKNINMIKSITSFLLIFTLTSIPYLITKIIEHQKLVYIVSALFLVIVFGFSRYLSKDLDSNIINLFSYLNNFNILYILGIFIFTIITQNQYLHFETISWDTPSYLVASLPIGDGYLPLEVQWDSKGPLFFYIYYFFIFLSGKSYVMFKIFHDILLFIISLLLYKTLNLKNNNHRLTSFFATILFTTIVSKSDYVSEYSEIYILLIVAYIYYKYIQRGLNLNNIFLTTFFVSCAFLINQVALIFVLPYIVSIIQNKQIDKNTIKYGFLGLTIPPFIVSLIYSFNDMFDLLVINYVLVPFGYANKGSESSINELRIWFREFFYYNKILYFALLCIITFEIVKMIRYKKNESLIITKLISPLYLNIYISILIYFIGGHNYSHHLVYLIYFIIFFFDDLRFNNSYIMLMMLILVASSSVFAKSFNQSYANLSNLNNIQNEYPLYKLSQEIDDYFSSDYEILALEYVLVLFYLDKPNYTYIVHPTNHFEDYIAEPLKNYGYLQFDNINKALLSQPDVVMCNPMRIHKGVPTDNINFDCNFSFYEEKYFQIETSEYRKDLNIEYYYDPYKDLNVFINKEFK